eukprot:1156370-Pelagomonas_calceolata.AAC.7
MLLINKESRPLELSLQPTDVWLKGVAPQALTPAAQVFCFIRQAKDVQCLCCPKHADVHNPQTVDHGLQRAFLRTPGRAHSRPPTQVRSIIDELHRPSFSGSYASLHPAEMHHTSSLGAMSGCSSGSQV